MATLTIEMPPHVTQAQMMQALDVLGCQLRLASAGRNYKAIPREGGFSGKAKHLQRIAQAHREAWGYQGGYVLLLRGEVCGWKQTLDFPEGWEPGTVAIDEAGRIWIAAGGNAYDGAERWDPTESAAKVVRLPVRQPTPPGAA